MILVEFDGKRPQVHPEAWVAPTATLIGDVTIEKGASVWYGSVLRGDVCSIVVREGTNIQDNCIVHGPTGAAVEIGPHTTVGHGCIVHGQRVGAQALVGNGAVLSDEVVVGDGSLVAAGAVVTPGVRIPEGVVVAGVPAKVRGPIEPGSTPALLLEHNAAGYVGLAEAHARSARVLPGADDLS